MPIYDTRRGQRQNLSLSDVKARLAVGTRPFESLPAAEQRYIESAAAGADEISFRDLTERALFTPAHSVSLPVIGTTVDYTLALSKTVAHAGARVRACPTDARKYIETHELVIEAGYKIRIRPFSGEWRIGFFQTVDALNRSVRYTARAQPRERTRATEIKTFINAPVRDATAQAADDAPPWYDKTAVRTITAEYVNGSVAMRDYPGMLINWDHANHHIALDATQSFTTYLVLRRSTLVGDALADAAGACVILAKLKWSSWFKLTPPSQEPTGGYDFESFDELADSAHIPAIPNTPVGKMLLESNQTTSRV